MGVSLTIGDVQGALDALPALAGALTDVVNMKPTWGDAETIGADGLAILAAVDPGAVGFILLGKIALALMPIVLANARPDPNPMQDAQTTEPSHTGRYG